MAHKDEIAATSTSPPRQLRTAASNGSLGAGAGGTLKLKSGRPRAPVPVSVLTNDPLWDAARNIPSPPPPPASSSLPPNSQPAAPASSLTRSASLAARPQLELDVSALPAPRRRVRKAHLERCITLQHGMLRERDQAQEEDVLARLSLYDDALSPLDLASAAALVEPLHEHPEEFEAFKEGPATAPSVLSSSVNREREEYFPTMAEILAAQEAEDAAQASLDASRTPDRSPMPPSSPSGTLFAVDRDSDVGSIHLQVSAAPLGYAEPRSAMSFPHTPAYTESVFPLSDKHDSFLDAGEGGRHDSLLDPLDAEGFPNTPAYTRSIFPLGDRHHSLYPETEAPRSPSEHGDGEEEVPVHAALALDRHRHLSSTYPETEAPRSPAESVFPPSHLHRRPLSNGSDAFPRESYPSLLHPDADRSSLAPSTYADLQTPAYSAMVFGHSGGLQTPSASTVAHLSHATSLDAFVFPVPPSPAPVPNNESTATLTPASPPADSHASSRALPASRSPDSRSPASRSPPALSPASHSPPALSPPSRSPASHSPSRSPQPQPQPHPTPVLSFNHLPQSDDEDEDPDTDMEMDIRRPARASAHFQSEPRHSVLTLSGLHNGEYGQRLSAVYDQLPLLTATISHFRGVDSQRFSSDGDGRRFSGVSGVTEYSRGVPSISPTVAYEQVMTLLHPPSSPARPEISKPIPLQDLPFPRSTPPERTQFAREARQRNDSMPYSRQRSDSVDQRLNLRVDSVDQRQRVDSNANALAVERRQRNDSLDMRKRNDSLDVRQRNDSLDMRKRDDSLDMRKRDDSLDRRQRNDSLVVPPTPLSPPAPTPPPKTNSVLRLAQRVQAQREQEKEDEGVRAFHLPTTQSPTAKREEAGPPPIPLPTTPASAVQTQAVAVSLAGLPAHPAQHVRGLSSASAASTTAPLQLQFPLPPPHARKGSLQPASASAAPSAFKFASPIERPGMNRSQSEQALRQKALIGALRAESGYFDSDEEDAAGDGKAEQEDALEALKREMMQWRDGVARESEKRALAEQEAARRKVQDEKRAPVMIEEPVTQVKTPPRSRVRKKRVPIVEMCERCGFERDSGECVLAHAAPMPGPGLVRRSSSRSITHERKDSGASSVGYARGLQRRATLHDRKDSASSTVGATVPPPRHTHDRRDSLARLNSALFASTAPAAAAAGPKTAPVTGHERTMSMMSGMSNASSFFSSDVNEIVLPGGRSFVSALEKLHTVSTTTAPSLKHARSTERLPLPPPVSTTPTAAAHKRGQSTEKFPSIRHMPSTERFAPPPPVASAAIRNMPSTERFASAERFAAFRERYGAGSDSTHNTFVTATQTGTSDLSHVPSTDPSTVVAYASVSASASAESSWSSFPPTPADADWEYAFSATKPAAQKNVLRSQRSQEAIRRGAAAGPALGSATISSTRGRAFTQQQQTSVYVPDEEVLSPEPAPKSASRWSEDSTRHAPRDKAPSKQASRTNLNSPSVTRLVRAPSVHSPGAGSSESPSTPASGGGGFAGLAKRLRLKSLPSKSKSPGGSGSSNSSGGGFGFGRLGGLGVKNKNSAQEMRSGWMG